MKVKSESEVTQSCPTLSNPMDCSLPGSSVHGIFQVGILEWVAISFSKRREERGKGEKERYTHLNAEFQRIARSDKKAFLSDQCKEIEENNRMGKTRDLFKKMRDTKGTYHAKMGSIKDRDGMDLTEEEDIKNRWQNTQKNCTKKDLHDPDNHDGVITHLEPDILECKVKWALGSITTNKTSGEDGIPVELFQILNDYVVKVLH